jgi:hypothetical protein
MQQSRLGKLRQVFSRLTFKSGFATRAAEKHDPAIDDNAHWRPHRAEILVAHGTLLLPSDCFLFRNGCLRFVEALMLSRTTRGTEVAGGEARIETRLGID